MSLLTCKLLADSALLVHGLGDGTSQVGVGLVGHDDGDRDGLDKVFGWAIVSVRKMRCLEFGYWRIYKKSLLFYNR
jgi:hypothetical protein